MPFRSRPGVARRCAVLGKDLYVFFSLKKSPKALTELLGALNCASLPLQKGGFDTFTAFGTLRLRSASSASAKLGGPQCQEHSNASAPPEARRRPRAACGGSVCSGNFDLTATDGILSSFRGLADRGGGVDCRGRPENRCKASKSDPTCRQRQAVQAKPQTLNCR